MKPKAAAGAVHFFISRPDKCVASLHLQVELGLDLQGNRFFIWPVYSIKRLVYSSLSGTIGAKQKSEK